MLLRQVPQLAQHSGLSYTDISSLSKEDLYKTYIKLRQRLVQVAQRLAKQLGSANDDLLDVDTDKELCSFYLRLKQQCVTLQRNIAPTTATTARRLENGTW